MRKEKILLLDMYGVIVKESKGNFIPYVYAHFPETDKQFLLNQFTMASYGEHDSATFLRNLGFVDPESSMRDYLDNHLTFDAEFLPFAERMCRECGYTLALVSNDVAEWSRYLVRKYGIESYFSEMIVSADVHARKPEAAIFRTALTRCGAAGEDCVFVDNSVKNLDAAAQLGIVPVLFNRDDETYSGMTVSTFPALAEVLL